MAMLRTTIVALSAHITELITMERRQRAQEADENCKSGAMTAQNKFLIEQILGEKKTRCALPISSTDDQNSSRRDLALRSDQHTRS